MTGHVAHGNWARSFVDKVALGGLQQGDDDVAVHVSARSPFKFPERLARGFEMAGVTCHSSWAEGQAKPPPPRLLI